MQTVRTLGLMVWSVPCKMARNFAHRCPYRTLLARAAACIRPAKRKRLRKSTACLHELRPPPSEAPLQT
eukprot:9521946-Lingulodinium_polyedra.AAC.1